MGRFEAALRRPGLGAIAEIKRRSPSAGDLRPDADPARIAPAYAAAGAAAISVLVDERFAGSWDDLRAARAATDAPLLAKGFFSTPDDLCTAKRAGADAVLLLLRDLDDATTTALMDEASRLGLDTLVEAHDRPELERAIALRAPVVGVNARDLATFAIDRAAQLELVAAIPSNRRNKPSPSSTTQPKSSNAAKKTKAQKPPNAAHWGSSVSAAKMGARK